MRTVRKSLVATSRRCVSSIRLWRKGFPASKAISFRTTSDSTFCVPWMSTSPNTHGGPLATW
jgi:hypothetical protein